MRVNRLLLGACISSVMAVLPAAAARTAPRQCVAAKPTPASYTWNFQKETDGIFSDIQSAAAQARYHADKLQSFTWGEEVSWEGHASQLSQLKADIDDMGGRLCRLETIRRVAAPWQQRIIDRIATTVRLMADNAQDAIVFENNNHDYLWSPTYRKYTENLYQEATNLTHAMDHAVEYAKVHALDRQSTRTTS